jgi:hypothetical protein
MRFQDDGVTPLLSVTPPDGLRGTDLAHNGNSDVLRARRGQPETLAWAYQRPDGGRGFGFTGGHYHANWENDNFRKVVLNAILWIAHIEVPPDGVASRVTPEQLGRNLDEKGPPRAAAPKPNERVEPAIVPAPN